MLVYCKQWYDDTVPSLFYCKQWYDDTVPSLFYCNNGMMTQYPLCSTVNKGMMTQYPLCSTVCVCGGVEMISVFNKCISGKEIMNSLVQDLNLA